MKKEKLILEKMQKETALNYLKKAKLLLSEIDFYTCGITKAMNDIEEKTDNNIVRIEKEIETYKNFKR